MIPALLSCVFVIYLYRKLNAPEPSSPEQDSSDENDDLASRLDALRERIARLDFNSSQGESS
ncbi:hypothetical protein [Rhodopirellula bahusiensis]|uniref:Phage shock protein B n=1 Tax=Rhodopirellula bahusiensis TaxID=2014065 RepID=A0A2G1WBK9_9BACT|nr:hypothetical protein [Rhodopirellula bahusiensis]PHQ36210.1 hypothetical protein CEE69_06000 [Rhodopirellula bahusiensis]